MSACISGHGEYSEHTWDESGYICDWCGHEDIDRVLDELTANTMALSSLEAEIEQAAVRVGVDLVGDDGERKGALQLLGEVIETLVKTRASLVEARDLARKTLRDAETERAQVDTICSDCNTPMANHEWACD